METIEIKINWNNLDSIKLAESRKLELENLGYSQINSFGGLNESVLIYGRKIKNDSQ